MILLEKKEIYANKDKVKTCYTITQDVIHNYNEWDVNSLERRKKELIEKKKLQIFYLFKL